MQTFLLIFFGFLSGVIGGMGMGGGTVLVPMLSFLDIPQKTVQAINLVSFLPMCAVALIFHAKNKLIQPKRLGWVVVPASLCAMGGAFFAGSTDNKILKLCFALFLVGVGVWQLVVALQFIAKQKKRLTVVYSDTSCLKAKPNAKRHKIKKSDARSPNGT